MRLTLAAVAAALLFPALALGAAGPSSADLEAELVCPTCKTTLDQSDAPIARRMKAIIRERLAAGATEQQIKDELVAQFGQAVLAEPPRKGFDLVAWLLPVALLVVGAVGVGALAYAWSRGRGDPEAVAPLDPELDRRIDDELARFEP